MYFYCLCILIMYVLYFLFSLYCLCVNVYCTTATGCRPNCSEQIAVTVRQFASTKLATIFRVLKNLTAVIRSALLVTDSFRRMCFRLHEHPPETVWFVVDAEIPRTSLCQPYTGFLPWHMTQTHAAEGFRRIAQQLWWRLLDSLTT